MNAINESNKKSANKTCLVLGGKGFVGSAIVREGQRRGWHVTSVDKEDYTSAIGTSVEVLINANGNSKKFLSNKEPKLDFDMSVRSVAESLHDFKYQKYVYLSTIDVYPTKDNPAENHEQATIDPTRISRYGHHKWLAEQLVTYNAASWLLIRMGGFIGPGLWKNGIYDLLTGSPLRVHPDSAYQYQHTDALASAVFTLIENKRNCEIFNIAGDGLITLREIAAMIPECSTGVEPDIAPERYEVNIDKIKSIYPVTQTRLAVQQFIEHVLGNKESILSRNKL